jgi:seryl-tRNA synthetase
VAEPGRPVPGAVEAALDQGFVGLAAEQGAVTVDPPYLLSRDFLERTEFFASFPQRAVPTGDGGSFLPPATCYRLFQALEGTGVEQPLVVTLTGPCFRREERYDDRRRRAFTMREVVGIGDEERVAGMRDALAQASLRLAQGLELDASLEEAADPFFVEASRGKRLLQRLMNLKVELVTTAAGETLPIASFNLHQDFFGSRLGIRVGGTPAWTACAAWGIERWRLALEERWGRASEDWLPRLRGLDANT